MAEKRKFAALAELHRQPPEAEVPKPTGCRRLLTTAASNQPQGGEGQGPSRHRQAQQPRMEALFPLPQTQDAARGSGTAAGRGRAAICPTCCKNFWKNG